MTTTQRTQIRQRIRDQFVPPRERRRHYQLSTIAGPDYDPTDFIPDPRSVDSGDPFGREASTAISVAIRVDELRDRVAPMLHQITDTRQIKRESSGRPKVSGKRRLEPSHRIKRKP